MLLKIAQNSKENTCIGGEYLFFIDGQATPRRPNHGQATSFSQQDYQKGHDKFSCAVYLSEKENGCNKGQNLWCVSASKSQVWRTNLPTDVLNNSIGEMFLFYKYNLSIVNISGNKIYLFIYLLFIKTLFKVGT